MSMSNHRGLNPLVPKFTETPADDFKKDVESDLAAKSETRQRCWQEMLLKEKQEHK